MTTDKLPGDPGLPSSAADLQTLINIGEQQSHKYSVEDFFRNPEKSNYQLSPGGNYFSYMAPYQRRKNIFVQKISEDHAIRLTSSTDRDISGYGWASSDRLIFIKDSGGDENFQLYAVNHDGTNPKDLTPYPGVRIQLIDILEDDEEDIIIGMNKNNAQLFEPYRINIKTGETHQLAQNDNVVEPIDSWMTDHEGKIRIATKVVNGTETVLMYRDSEEESFREVLKTDFTESMSPLFFDFEKDHVVYASSNLGRDKAQIVQFDLKAGKELDTIFKHDEVDVSGLRYSRKRKVLTSIVYLTDKRHLIFLDKKSETWFRKLESLLPGYEISISSHNKNEDKFIVRTFTDRSLGSYYFFDSVSGELQKIADVSPWLDESELAEMKPVSYQTRDGLTIHGYLTLPPHKEAKNLPIIVNPHGGPWVRDSWGYNPEVQLFATRGYGVFQMNYRGSTGYGKEFFKSSFKQWGRTMQNDITDGVEWLINAGIADRKHIAIYGGSYGGYATLAGVTFTPDLYCCAIDYVGVSNLFTFMKTIPPYWKPYLDMMYEMVGNPETDKESMQKTSPVFHVDNIKTPLFVVQGANDPRVNIDESDQIVLSLRSRGIDVPYLVKYDEGHGFHNEENRFEMYKATLGFLSKYLS
ncbi:MAG: S9 family peptidase [Saprospiraceae bacterium]|nr:S9 family peptidase [Saprospiraceae bacterium]